MKMEKLSPLKYAHLVLGFLVLFEGLNISSSLNDEGAALMEFRNGIELDPNEALKSWRADDPQHCNWFGVKCSADGRVVALTLKDLDLKGTLSPALGALIGVKIIDLRNNFFSGVIPAELRELKDLETLDLRHNDLHGTVPSVIHDAGALQVLLLEGNRVSVHVPKNPGSGVPRKILQSVDSDHARGDAHNASSKPEHSSPLPLHSSAADAPDDDHKDDTKTIVIACTVSAGIVILVALGAVYLVFFRRKKTEMVTPWATGLSGQLQKAFVSGVPSLGRPEIEAACEHFSNVIGALPDCTMYKGTLSSGVEIAVIKSLATTAEEWPSHSEEQFRKKIEVLSRVNHKNFLNLLGYCNDDVVFTRMMVFEYAPCGTLFEHLHMKEVEPLNWLARLRIAMGVIYCLEYMDRLSPPVAPRNLSSSSIYITEDLAAKISDVGFRKEEKDGGIDDASQESVVYKYAILLLEVISGRLPFSEDDGLVVLWASSYLSGKRPLNKMVDSTLAAVPEEHIAALCGLIQLCISPEPEERPSVPEVAMRMRDITGIRLEAAAPKNSPLWWAELEIASSEAV